MKRPLAYITAPWKGDIAENAEQAGDHSSRLRAAIWIPLKIIRDETRVD